MQIRNKIYLLPFLGISSVVFAQTPGDVTNQADYKEIYKQGGIANTITTTVPFLNISPDARAGGMGDIGVATAPDASSMHFNLAKSVFQERQTSVAISYSPWLRNLIPDVNLAYLSFNQKIKDFGAVSASLRYFSLGDITFTDNTGGVIGQYKPNEFALDVGYSQKLIDNLSMAVAFRFIYSNLTLGQTVNGQATRAGLAGAGDISLYYQNDKWEIAKRPVVFRYGLALTNLGSKIRYSQSSKADFIPMNFRTGAGLTFKFDDYNSLQWAFEINKLLVPTAPLYKRDNNGNFVDDDGDGEPDIEAGMDPHRNVVNAMFTSFGDAPGGFREELDEFNIATGLEYWYNRIFSARVGYSHESTQKGGRRYFTVGAGVRYSVFGLDFSYLIPIVQRNPLENTIRFSLVFDFDKLSKINEESSKPYPGRGPKKTK